MVEADLHTFNPICFTLHQTQLRLRKYTLQAHNVVLTSKQRRYNVVCLLGNLTKYDSTYNSSHVSSKSDSKKHFLCLRLITKLKTM